MLYNNRFYWFAVLLSICVLIETLAFTYLQDMGGVYYYSSSILYFLSGIGVCVIPLLPIVKGGNSLVMHRILSSYIPILFSVFFICILLYHIYILMQLYDLYPIDVRWADMLPVLKVGCQRFLAGKEVYGHTPVIWSNLLFSYFPMMWIPFLPAELFSFDYRWTTLIFQFTALAVVLFPFFKQNRYIPVLPSLIAGISFFLFLNFFLVRNFHYWVLTEEGVVTAFYLVLGVLLLGQNYLLIGIAMTCCTLSRFGLLFWIPVYFGFVFFTQPRLEFWKLFFSYGLSMSVLFIFPFFIKEPSYFLNIPNVYNRMIDRFWTINLIDEHRYYHVGFFKFFTAHSAPSMSIWAFVSSFMSPLLLLFSFERFKDKFQLNMRYIAYSSLKISLMFFYGFLSMPFQYVFVSVTILSYVVLFDFITNGGYSIPEPNE